MVATSRRQNRCGRFQGMGSAHIKSSLNKCFGSMGVYQCQSDETHGKQRRLIKDFRIKSWHMNERKKGMKVSEVKIQGHIEYLYRRKFRFRKQTAINVCWWALWNIVWALLACRRRASIYMTHFVEHFFQPRPTRPFQTSSRITLRLRTRKSLRDV